MATPNPQTPFDMSCIQRGASLLDSYFGGPQWRNNTDLNTLTFISPYNHLLAQLFGGHRDRGFAALSLSTREQREQHGFLIPIPNSVADYDALREAWKIIIKRQ